MNKATKCLRTKSSMNNPFLIPYCLECIVYIGARFFPLYGKAPYVVTQFLAHGFLDVAITNNGKTLSGEFYANDGSIIDEFTINKVIKK